MSPDDRVRAVGLQLHQQTRLAGGDMRFSLVL